MTLGVFLCFYLIFLPLSSSSSSSNNNNQPSYLHDMTDQRHNWPTLSFNLLLLTNINIIEVPGDRTNY